MVRLTNGANSAFRMASASPFNWPPANYGTAQGNVVASSFVSLFSPTNTIQITAQGQVELDITGTGNQGQINSELRAIITSTDPVRQVTLQPYIWVYNDGDPVEGIVLDDGEDAGLLIFTFWIENFPAGTGGHGFDWERMQSRVRFVNANKDVEFTASYDWKDNQDRAAVNSVKHQVNNDIRSVPQAPGR